jgi:hypothetical protein
MFPVSLFGNPLADGPFFSVGRRTPESCWD